MVVGRCVVDTYACTKTGMHANQSEALSVKLDKAESCFLSWSSLLHDCMVMQRGDRDGDVGMV